jgi:hypothetical protein
LSEFTDAAGAARLGMAAHLRAVTAARRAETDLAVLDANRLHAAARDLAVSAPAFAPAFGAYCAGQPVVPLTADGSAALPDCEPTRDLARLIGYWTEHPSAPAGLPTGLEPDLIAAATDTSAWEWLRNSSVSSAAEGDRPPQRLDPVFGLVRLIEQRPASSPWRSTTFFGHDKMAEAGNKLNSTTTPAVREILVWRWPSGWTLRPGRWARGIHLLSVVPADGGEIHDAGKRWRCQWSGGGIGRLQRMPAWVADILDGTRTAAP